tara:strand:+ start:217 stop:771 length:555 start_codon:yes stop_codon:yes gene_type:complete
MERRFKCSSCGKILDLFQIRRIPGEVIVEPDGFTYETGKNYCDDCFENQTTGNVLYDPSKKKPKETKLKEKINFEGTILEGITKLKKEVKFKDADLIENAIVDQNINLIVEVKEKIKEKIVKNGLRVGLFKIEDSSGEIVLVLWNKLIDIIRVNDKIYIENGYVRDWQGEKRITPGKTGMIRKI